MKRILVLIDFSEMASSVLRAGGELARCTGAKLLLVHVALHEEQLEDEAVRGSPPRQQVARAVRHHRRALEILELELERQGTDVERKIVSRASRRSSPVKIIIEEVAAIHPDLIVMGTRQRSKLRRFFLGSVSDAVVRIAKCPVVLVPRHMTSQAAIPPVNKAG
jgi:nucleotide-binding universal stress UspA family protein